PQQRHLEQHAGDWTRGGRGPDRGDRHRTGVLRVRGRVRPRRRADDVATARPGEWTRPGRDDGGMLEGIRYVMRNRIFFATIGLSFLTSVFGQSYVVLLPVFASDVLGVGATGFGAMEAAAGIGALLGTLSVVKLGAGDYRGPVMLFSAAIFGL